MKINSNWNITENEVFAVSEVINIQKNLVDLHLDFT